MLLPTVSLWKRFRNWTEKVIDVKVKALLLTGFLATFTVVAFQYQVSALSTERFNSVCAAKIQAREDLRSILFYVVDVSDVFPEEPLAEEYTSSRIDYIEDRYPSLVADPDC